MLFTQQIVDSLYRIECRQRHLNEYGIPIAHRTIPQSWQLQSLQLLTRLRLLGDEARSGINILRQILFDLSICELSRICRLTVPS